MTKKDKNFYIWTLKDCIKSTYEYWGIDMMSMYKNFEKDFPIAAVAINKMYASLAEPDVYKSQFIFFEKIQYVYEAIANLIPQHDDLLFDIKTKEQSSEYERLNICSWNKFVKIKRIDLLMAVLLFTEEFILQPISAENVALTYNSLAVDGNFVKLRVSKFQDKTNVSILIKDVMLLEYILLN